MAETVYKSAKRKGFTVIYRSVAQDKRLSLKARGLFLLLQSLPEDWSFNQRGIATVAGVGREQVRSALKELEAAGYLVTEQAHDGAGKFSGAVVTLREEAEPEAEPCPEPAEPCPEAAEQSPESLEPCPEPAKPCPEPAELEAAEQSPESLEPCSDTPSSGNPVTDEPLSENPLSENPLSGNLLSGNPLTENPTLQNNKINKNKIHTPHTPHGGRSAPKWKPERFEKFWTFYRSFAVGKQGPRLKAVRAWDRLKPSDILIDRMARVLSAQADSDMWRRGIGIPYAASWLNGRRWEDEIVPDGLADGARLADEAVLADGAGLSAGAVLPCALPFLTDDDPERGRFL